MNKTWIQIWRESVSSVSSDCLQMDFICRLACRRICSAFVPPSFAFYIWKNRILLSHHSTLTEISKAALLGMGSDMARWKMEKSCHFHQKTKMQTHCCFPHFHPHPPIPWTAHLMGRCVLSLQVTVMWYLPFCVCSSGKWSAMSMASIPRGLTMETVTCSWTGSVFTIMRPQVSCLPNSC